MALTANQEIAIWTITGDKLYARTFDQGESFWLCQQVEGTPGGTVDEFILREPHMLAGANLTWLNGLTAITGPALAAELEKFVYEGDADDTTTRTVNGLGKTTYPTNFPASLPGYARGDVDGTIGLIKANTNPTKTVTGSTTDPNAPAPTGIWAKYKYYIIGVGAAVVSFIAYKLLKKRK